MHVLAINFGTIVLAIATLDPIFILIHCITLNIVTVAKSLGSIENSAVLIPAGQPIERK
jgi:hypothetical protein